MRGSAPVAAWILLLGAMASAGAAPVVPGPRPDGSTLLHNQWSIHPAGRQYPLGDFPVAAAVDPRGAYAAVLHAGYGGHEVRLVNLATGAWTSAPVHEAFAGIAFSGDGGVLACSGGSDGVIHLFSVASGTLKPLRDVRVVPEGGTSIVTGLALSRDLHSAVVAVAFTNQIVRVDLDTGRVVWALPLGGAAPVVRTSGRSDAPNDVVAPTEMIGGAVPLNVLWDERRQKVYASLWGESSVAVLDARSGSLMGKWQTGLHPNEMVLSRDGRLFVSNGGLNTVTVLDAGDGSTTEVLSSAVSAGDPPGYTPDSLALSRDGRTLFVANAYTDTVAVFDVGTRGQGRPLGFIPTGWFPSTVRLTADGRRLVVVSARGLLPRPSGGPGVAKAYIASLYSGSLGVVDLPKGEAFERALASWTKTAQDCRPKPPEREILPGDPIPAKVGGASPIRYVIYVIKENRTYDQVFGDVPRGNGDPNLCLFGKDVTPNLHAIASQFVLLDNFYANAEVSASGHDWSMAAYSSEFVEKTWPVYYGHPDSHMGYSGEAHYLAGVPALGFLWDRAAAAKVSFESFGEFTVDDAPVAGPMTSRLPSLRGHVDPDYRGWDIHYPDRERASTYIARLKAFESRGDMPRLQILRLPNDHTEGGKAGALTPRAMVADNDQALGRIVEALSHSRFWGSTAVFVVEDDAQNGPDHVDAHRTEALVAGGFVRRGVVDSTPYTTCSMLRTIELILGLEPMSEFDAAAVPMRDSFQPRCDLTPYAAVAPGVDLAERNPVSGPLAEASRGFDFSKEDRVDEQAFNRVLWAAVRGPGSRMPAPVHAAFVRRVGGDDDDDD